MRPVAGDSSLYTGVLGGSPARTVKAKVIAGYGATTAALVVFVCRVLIASAVVPPWQGPDEPTHFALATLVAQGTFTQQATADIERATLQSMSRHGWWRFYQEPTPDPLPYAFSQVPEHLASGTLDQPAYYILAAAVLRTVGDSDIDRQYFALRLLSITLALLTLLFGWLGTRAFFGSRTATGALALVSLHPQFLLSAISVNPDVLIDLCGAFVWWQTSRLAGLQPRGRVMAIVLAGSASLVAAFSKRNGLPLALVWLVATTLVLRTTDRRLRLRIAVAAIVVALGCVAAAYVIGGYSESFGRLWTYWGSAVVARRSLADLTPSTLLFFVKAAIDTAWLYAGWLRFPPPAMWAWVARTLTIVGLGGAAWLALRRKSNDVAFLLAWTFVAVYACTLLGIAFISAAAPQGRYVFAVMFPFAALLWRGLLYSFRPVLKAYAPVAIVGIVAALDTCGFVFVLLPAYVYHGAAAAF